MNNTRNRYQRLIDNRAQKERLGRLGLSMEGGRLPRWIHTAQTHHWHQSRVSSKAAAKRMIDGLRLEINSEASSISVMTVGELIVHYSQTELSDGSAKIFRTKQVYGHHLSKVISPSWGTYRLRDVKPIASKLGSASCSWLRARRRRPKPL